MKRTALLSLILVFFIPSRISGIGIVLGVKGGAATNSYFGADYWSDLNESYAENAMKIGYTSGIFSTFEFLSILALQPELLMVQSGNAVSEEAVVWGLYEGRVRHIDSLIYLTAPILFKLNLRSMSIYIGPEARFRIGNGISRFEATDEALQEMLANLGMDAMLYASDVFSPRVFAAVVGTEYLFPSVFLRGEWAIESRARYVFSNIYSEGQGSFYEAYEVSLMVSCGWRIYGSKARGLKKR